MTLQLPGTTISQGKSPSIFDNIINGAGNFFGGLIAPAQADYSIGTDTYDPYASDPNYNSMPINPPRAGDPGFIGPVKPAGTVTTTNTPTPTTPQSTGGGNGFPTNPNVNQFHNGYRWTGVDWAPPAGQGQGDLSTQISEAYQPAIDALGFADSTARTGAADEEASTIRNWQTGVDRAGQEQTTLTGDQQLKQDAFNKELKSAYEKSLRLYNALKQQGIARYGGGSSAGEFISDLSRQEMFKQQRDIGEQQSTGDVAFAKQFAQIGQYIGNKITDLDNWKFDAMGQIKQNLGKTLVEISQRRGEIEGNKTKDKIAALQIAKDKVELIQQNDIKFRRDLALASISQAQEISGRAFTAAEISARLAEWGIPMNGATSTAGSSSILANISGPQKKDEFGNLIG